jgi:alpha-L-fucosidase
MKSNGDSIYGTTASPISRPEWGRITKKVDGDTTTLYLHVFDWPADGKLPVSVDNEVVSCSLLAEPNREFDVERVPGKGLTVNLQGAAADPIASVVKLQLRGEPVPLAD